MNSLVAWSIASPLTAPTLRTFVAQYPGSVTEAHPVTFRNTSLRTKVPRMKCAVQQVSPRLDLAVHRTRPLGGIVTH